MSGPEASSAAPRQRWIFGAVAVVVGVVLAIGAALLLGGGGGTPIAATGEPTFAGASGGATSIPSASAQAPTESPSVSTAPTLAPTTAPTLAPTAPPPATATPTPNTNPRIVSFTVPGTEDCTDDTAGSIQVSWAVVRATGVTISIDGPGIFDTYTDTSDTITLPFGCSTEVLSHTYTLRTTGGSGPAATQTKTVRTAAPTIVTFDMPDSAGCQSSSGSVAIALEYQVSAATGVALYQDGQIYGNYNGKSSSNGLTVPYDCTKGSQLFRLVTSGGYGPADEATLTVTDGLP